MDFECAKAFFYKQWIKTTRGWAELAWFTVYPLVALFTAGFFLQFLKGDPTAVVYFLVGTFVWNFYMLCQKGITYGLLYDVWAYCLKHTVVSKATIADFVLGNGLFGLVSGVASMLIANAFSIVFFQFNLLDAGIVLVAALIAILLYSISEGLVINALVVLKGYQYQSLTWIVTGIIMVLSAVYYPVELLPAAVRPISFILPTTHAIGAIRNAMLGKEFVFEALLGLGLSVVYVIAAMAVFSFALNKSRETGFLAKL